MMVGNVFVNATTTTFLRWVYVIDCSAKKEIWLWCLFIMVELCAHQVFGILKSHELRRVSPLCNVLTHTFGPFCLS